MLQASGFELVLAAVYDGAISVAVEAAGVLTQLTAPGRTMIRLPTSDSEQLVTRLLTLVDEVRQPEALLLVCAALHNCAHGAIASLYQ